MAAKGHQRRSRIVLGVGLAIIVALSAIAANVLKEDDARRSRYTDEPAPTPEELALELDEEAAGAMDGDVSDREARRFLASRAGRRLENDRQEAQALTEALYQAGAPRVVVSGVEEAEYGALMEGLVAELPRAGSARARVFQVAAEFAHATGDTPPPDVGQRFLLFSLQ